MLIATVFVNFILNTPDQTVLIPYSAHISCAKWCHKITKRWCHCDKQHAVNDWCSIGFNVYQSLLIDFESEKEACRLGNFYYKLKIFENFVNLCQIEFAKHI